MVKSFDEHDVLGLWDPLQCVIDHNNEETMREVRDRGFFAAFSIYPATKMGNERMTEIVHQNGSERIIIHSAATGAYRSSCGAKNRGPARPTRYCGGCYFIPVRFRYMPLIT